MRRDELNQLRSRISVVVYAITAVLLALIAGFWHFQLAESNLYAELADKNRFKQIPLVARRGKILDREKRILVDNRPAYDIVYRREGTKHTVQETVEMLAPGIGMTPQELLERVDKKKSEQKFRPIVLKEDVHVADIA